MINTLSQAPLAAKNADPPRRHSLGRCRAWLAAGIVPALLLPVWMVTVGAALAEHPVGTGAVFVLLLMLGVCCVSDVMRRKIPNWATYSGFAWALLLSGLAWWLSSGSTSGAGAVAGRLAAVSLSQAAWGGAACFGPMFLIYTAAGGGAGDVKLMSAVGAFLGPRLGLQTLLCSYVAAAVGIVAWSVWTEGPVTLLRALYHKFGAVLLPLWIAAPSEAQRRVLRRPMPMAPAFALGTVIALIAGDMLP